MGAPKVYPYGVFVRRVGQLTTTSRRLYYPVEQMENRMIFGGECCSANFMGFMQGALSPGATLCQGDSGGDSRGQSEG